jgi:hypothetical protein
MSELATTKWASNDVAVPGLESMDEDQAYRGMDLLVAADASARSFARAAPSLLCPAA